jgi:hypothetical protein
MPKPSTIRIRTLTPLLAVVLMFVVWLACLAGASAQSDSVPTKLSDDEELLISVQRLTSSLSKPGAATLFGATWLYGFVLTNQGGQPDCILVADIEPGRPTLRLDDFAVAYHNVTESQQRPACTINPRAETLQKLSDLARRIGAHGNPAEIEALLRDWKQVACLPQDVIVFGVSSDTHFARVMVDADYYMKSICNGTAEIEGVTSFSQICISKAKKEIHQTGRLSMATSVYNRFWFNPGKESFYRTDNNGAMILDTCPVVLLTEQEAVTPQGRLRGGTGSDPLAKKFADDFTGRYKAVAQRKPMYRELENLYRHVAVADLLVKAGKGQGSIKPIEDLVRAVQIQRHPFQAALPGRYSVDKVEGSKETAQGTLEYRLWMPTCGGVSIAIDLDLDRQRSPDPQGLLASVARSVLAARPSPKSLWWSVRSEALRRLVKKGE